MQLERTYKSSDADRARAKRQREADPEKYREYLRQYRARNAERLAEKERSRAMTPDAKGRRRENNRRYRERNKERVAARLAEYAKENRERVADAKRKYKSKLLASPAGRLNSRISAQIRAGLGRGRKAGRSMAELTGWTTEELATHLERQFVSGMGWHNIGEWHIDHIVPLSHFMKAENFDAKAAWALSNLRPIFAKDNLRKGAKREFLI